MTGCGLGLYKQKGLNFFIRGSIRCSNFNQGHEFMPLVFTIPERQYIHDKYSRYQTKPDISIRMLIYEIICV